MAQFVIDDSDMPVAPEEYPISLGALGPTAPQLGKDGQGVIWDYTDMDHVGQRVDSFFTVDDTPFAYRVNFDDPFDPDYQADHAQRRPEAASDSIALPIEVEDRYDYFKKKNSGYELLGIGATVNGFPTSTKYDPKDTVHHFPLQYGAIDSSYGKMVFDAIPDLYYEQERWRYDTVDGEGTVHTPFGDFDCLRIKTRLRIRDSLKSDSLNIDTALFRPVRMIYRWMAEDKGVPVLLISERGGTENRVEYLDSLRTSSSRELSDHPSEEASIHPVPANDRLFIELKESGWERYELYSLTGERLDADRLDASPGRFSVDLSGYSEGVYLLRLEGEKGVIRKRVVKGE